jgi:hypothetical protein
MKLNNLFGNPELIKVSELRPYGHNAKHFDQSVYNDLEKSFKEFGDVGICLCDLDGTLIDGNTRLKFFKDNNIESCYVRKAIKKLNEKQVVRLNAILDNIGNKPDFSVIDVEILEEIKVDYDTVIVEIEEIDEEYKKQPKEDTYDGKFPLAIVLMKRDYEKWRGFKKAYQLASDTDAFLKLMDEQLIQDK